MNKANENRLIYANDMKTAFREWFDHDDYRTMNELIDDVPTVDAVEVVHASWIEDGYYENPFVCSHCGSEGCYSGNFNNKQYYYTNYCPNCGANMLEVDDV